MHPSRRTLPFTARRRREEMGFVPTGHGRAEGQGEEAWSMEPVLAEESFHTRSGLLKFGIWVDGRVYGQKQDSF